MQYFGMAETGGEGMIENICTIIYKDGRYKAVDIEKKEVYSCKALGLALMAAHQITMEWAERHKKENHNADTSD